MAQEKMAQTKAVGSLMYESALFLDGEQQFLLGARL